MGFGPVAVRRRVRPGTPRPPCNRLEHGLRLAPAVALALEHPVVVRHSVFRQRERDPLRLVGGHHLVVAALEDGQRVAEVARLVDRGTFDEQIFPLRVGAHQAVEIFRLELVGGLLQLDQIPHAVVGDARPEEPGMARQGVQDGESPRRAALDHHPPRIQPPVDTTACAPSRQSCTSRIPHWPSKARR
jgi:hypothetical protein